MGRRRGIPGFSFSWKRASGLSATKSKLSRELGIPLTKGGRQRKVGRAMGCCAPAVGILVGMLTLAGGGLAVASRALAHGGGLNKDGCHTNRKTGDYHCHRTPAAQASTPARQQLKADEEVRYANCAEAREAGAAPLQRGDPGYSTKLDRDGDGTACE